MRRPLVVLLLACAAIARGSAAAPPAAQFLQLGARVSLPGSGPHFWWTTVTSPTDPDRVVVCGLRNNPANAQYLQSVIYGSIDAGQTWRLLKASDVSIGDSEVSCALSHERTIYFVFSSAAPGTLHFYRSDDFGGTWKTGPTANYADSAKLVVEPGATPDRDRILLFADTAMRNGRWALGDGLTIFDRGGMRIVQNAVPLPNIPGFPVSYKRVSWSSEGLGIANTADGLYMEPAPTSLDLATPHEFVLRRVTATGVPIGTPIQIARLATSFNRTEHAAALDLHFTDHRRDEYFALFRYPSIAYGPLPGSRGTRAYIVWHDIINNHLRIFFAVSNDEGVMWSQGHIIDDAPLRVAGNGDPRPSAPSVAVNRDGVVATSWAEFSGKCWRIAFSYDGGKSFSPSTPINPCEHAKIPLTDILGSRLNGGPTPGHTMMNDWSRFLSLIPGTSLAAGLDGSFYAAWTAYGTLDESLHVTRIVPAGVMTPRERQLQSIIAAATCCVDIKTHRAAAWVEWRSLDYDRATRQIVARVVLARDITETRGWPLVLRIRTLHSVLGRLSASNADNRVTGPGAAWVFYGPGTYVHGRGMPTNFEQPLTPGRYEFSKPRVVRFMLTDPQPSDATPGQTFVLDADVDVLQGATE